MGTCRLGVLSKRFSVIIFAIAGAFAIVRIPGIQTPTSRFQVLSGGQADLGGLLSSASAAGALGESRCLSEPHFVRL